jgi:anti-sigma factor ChrR (cupin superfamily)
MTAHLSDAQIRAYRERSLAAAELLSVSEHIGECGSCRTRISEPEQLWGGVRAMRQELRAAASAAHLSYEEMAAYTDRTMASGERERVEAHARECSSCAGDLAEIRMLRSEIGESHTTEQRIGLRLRSLLGWRGGLALAAACAVLIAVIARPPSGRSPAVTKVARPGPAGATIKDGNRQFVLLAGGQIPELEGLPDAERAYIEQALSGKPLERAAALQGLTSRPGVLLGAPSQPAPGKLLEPVATVVETQRPTFRWQPIAGALYRVSVFDSAYNAIAASGWVNEGEWQVSTPLRRGARYSWQIAVRQNRSEFTVPTPPAPEARFRVLGEAEEVEISKARSEFGGSYLVLGLLYARAGLLDDAWRELSALRDQNPGSAQVAALVTSLERERLTREPLPSQ